MEGVKSVDKRQKASDIFQQTTYLMGEKTTFEKAFPNIKDIGVTVEESSDGFSEGVKRYFSKDSASEFIDCRNPLCYNGGFSLGSLIRHMEDSHMTELSTVEYCQGYEGSPKGRKKYGLCGHSFEVKIQIKYKKEEPGGPG